MFFHCTLFRDDITTRARRRIALRFFLARLRAIYLLLDYNPCSLDLASGSVAHSVVTRDGMPSRAEEKAQLAWVVGGKGYGHTPKALGNEKACGHSASAY